MKSRRPSRLLGGACLLAAMMAATTSVSGQHPNHAQGFKPEHVFELGGLENVNLFNGNLTLTIPIGGPYPVGPELSYGLTLVWTGNVWHWDARADGPVAYLQAEPRSESRNSAGLGWELSLGRLLDAADPANPHGGASYQSPDQALHPLGSAGTSPDVVRSRDGTYLRHTQSQDKVESPDGTVRLFGPHGLTRMEDPFGNGLTIAYLNLDAQGDPRLWQITDDHGRVQKIVFTRIAGRLVVDRVELTRFGGATPAIYELSYSSQSIPRACNEPVTDDHCSGPGKECGNISNVVVPLLTSVTLPDGSVYSMPVGNYELGETQACQTGQLLNRRILNGQLERLELPTGGALEWDWDVWRFPEESRHHGGVRQGNVPPGLVFTTSAGLTARRHRKRGGDTLGDWTYTHTNHDAPGTTRKTESRTTVIDPLNHQAVHYFSVYQDDFVTATPEPPGWDQHEYGLPFTRRVSDGTSPGRFLSREVIGQGGATLRTVYVRYERDGASPDNPRMASQRTVYENGQRADLNLSSFDGLGHYRQAVATGNFPGVASRTTFTNWNPNGAPADSAPWVLDMFDLRQVTQGTETVTQELDFHADGFLSRIRTRKHAACGPEDVVVNHVRFPTPGNDPDQRGYVRLEKVYGGDGASLPCGDLGTLALPAQDDFRTRHTYTCGVLSKTEILDPANGSLALLPLDRDVHCNTGLVSGSRDTAGLQTSFSYDLLGRITSEKPGGGEAETVYIYTPESANSRAKVAIRRKAPNGTILSGGQVEFDGFGRVEKETRDLPNGGQAERISSWTARGDLFARTEWHAPNTATGTTSFSQIDPFGRPRRIFLPDGFQIDIGYGGVGSRSIAVPVATGTSPGGEPTFTTATTTETYDRFGRLLRLTEPNGTRTSYSYDAQGNLTRVEMNDLGTPIQVRTFAYDHRGFLGSETHPELGTSVVYSDYDALGNPRRIQRGGWDLAYAYDPAGRLTEVRERGTTRLWKEWEYATDNLQAGSRGKGKLASAVRHNRVLVPGTTIPIEPKVTESYRYDGVGGRLSDVTTTVNLSADPLFEYSLSYDPLGNVVSRSYPTCSDADPFNADTFFCFQANVPRTVSHTFTEGLLTAVPNYASSIAYHPNGLLAQVAHTNGVTDVQENDPSHMARPARLRTTGASQDFDTGRFGYDGAGNVTKMGPNRFTYDLLSRVVSGEVATVADVCTEDSHFQFVTFPGTLTVESCGEITTGSSVRVASTADVTFRAGERIVLGNGFRVDAGGRFTAEVDPSIEPVGGVAEATWEGGYDRFGNLTSMTTERPGGSAVTRTPVANQTTNRLVQTGTAYDTSGNVTARLGWEYAYDPFNMLWQAKRSGTSQGHTFVYGPGDERLWTVAWPQGSNSQVWTETWTLRDLDGSPLRQFRSVGGNQSGNWSLFADYIHRGGALLAAETQQGRRHVHLDHLGTPRLVTNAVGTTQTYHAYFPFGEEATSPTDSTIPLQYTGHERDDLEAGAGFLGDLDYMIHRFHSPHLGRFLSVDPIGAAPSWPQSWNRYSYVLGNPVKYIDPRGELPLDVVGQIGQDLLQCVIDGGCDFIEVTDTFDPLTGVQGLGSLLSGRSFLNSLSAQVPGGSGRRLRSPSDDTAGIIGFGCDDLISPAVSIGAAGGALLGGAADLLATPNRFEVTGTVGFGLGAGISVSPLGLSTGKSEGPGIGFATVLGMPAGLNLLAGAGLSNFFGEEILAGGNVGIGVGAGEAAAGGITYTFVLYNRCN